MTPEMSGKVLIMIRWLQGLWYGRCRKLDMEILWPSCLEQAHDLDHAKMAFAVHAFNDPAWMFLGHDAVRSFIDGLTEDNHGR